MFVFGFGSNRFLMSAWLPSNVTTPMVEYFTTLGLVVIKRLKLSITWSVPFFCSSSLAFTSKKSSPPAAVYCPVLSAWRLSIRTVTVTPETEYFGQMTDSPNLLWLFHI